MRYPISIALASSLSFVAVSAAAHIRMDSPTPRSVVSEEAGPCGPMNSARGDSPLVLQGGQELTLEWTETVHHANSRYRIALLLDGDDFPEPSSNTAAGDCDPEGDAWCIVDGLPDQGSMDNSYSYTFTVPNVDCDNCTLQVMQRTFINYYQCADITIVAQPDGGGMGGASSTGGSGNGPGTGSDPAPGSGSGSDEPPETADNVDSGAEERAGTKNGGSGCSLSLMAPPAGTFWGVMLLPLSWGARRGYKFGRIRSTRG